jgi:hypothetical protein
MLLRKLSTRHRSWHLPSIGCGLVLRLGMVPVNHLAGLQVMVLEEGAGHQPVAMVIGFLLPIDVLRLPAADGGEERMCPGVGRGLVIGVDILDVHLTDDESLTA